jgi:hypothetical protein
MVGCGEGCCWDWLEGGRQAEVGEATKSYSGQDGSEVFLQSRWGRRGEQGLSKASKSKANASQEVSR